MRAKAVFDNADQSLWPGQFVETRVTVRTLEGATVVPAAALMMLADGSSVYVVDADQHGHAAQGRSRSTPSARRWRCSGVEPGEQVVIEGKQNVRPGGKVRTRRAARRSAPAPAARPPGSAASVSAGNASLVAERERT